VKHWHACTIFIKWYRKHNYELVIWTRWIVYFPSQDCCTGCCFLFNPAECAHFIQIISPTAIEPKSRVTNMSWVCVKWCFFVVLHSTHWETFIWIWRPWRELQRSVLRKCNLWAECHSCFSQIGGALCVCLILHIGFFMILFLLATESLRFYKLICWLCIWHWRGLSNDKSSLTFY
jgi:hypothetical protein